ncbi:MAG: glycosyltransferase, partial [Myxococcaceae bacterium]
MPASAPREAPVRNRVLVEFAQMEKTVAEYHRELLSHQKAREDLHNEFMECGRTLDVVEREKKELESQVAGLRKSLTQMRGTPTDPPSAQDATVTTTRPLTDEERARLRVLFIAERDDASYRYRCIQACEQLRKSGCVANVAWLNDQGLPDKVSDYSIIVLFRTRWSDRVAHLIKQARAAGTTVAFGIDDLVFHASAEALMPFLQHLPEEMVEEYRNTFGSLQRTIEASDVCVVSTPTIARHIARLGKPAVLHPNLIPTAFEQLSRVVYPLRRALIRTPFIGYMSGSKTHDGDLQSISEPLARAMTRRPELKLMLCGPLSLPETLHPFIDRTVQFEYLDWRIYPWLMARCRVALAPLEVINDFTDGKSALKVFEAGVFGVPVIAAPTAPYQQAIQDGITGYVADSASRWEDAIVELTDEGKSLAFGRRARRLALRQYSSAGHSNVLAYNLLPWAGRARIGPPPTSLPLGARLEEIRDRHEAYRLARSTARAVLRSPAPSCPPTSVTVSVAQSGERAAELLNAVAASRRENRQLCLNGVRIGDILADRERPIGSEALASSHLVPAAIPAAPGTIFEASGDDPSFMFSPRERVGVGTNTLVVQLKCTADASRSAQLYWAVSPEEPFVEDRSVRFAV